jgi:hypothetical protein
VGVHHLGAAGVEDHREHQVDDQEQPGEQQRDPRPRRGAQEVVRVLGQRGAQLARQTAALEQQATARIDDRLDGSAGRPGAAA